MGRRNFPENPNVRQELSHTLRISDKSRARFVEFPKFECGAFKGGGFDEARDFRRKRRSGTDHRKRGRSDKQSRGFFRRRLVFGILHQTERGRLLFRPVGNRKEPRGVLQVRRPGFLIGELPFQTGLPGFLEARFRS